jgi:sec-independent protein translocase protein TatA
MIGPIGFQELLILLFLVVLLFGAKRIPTLARNIGQSFGEFAKGRRESAPTLETTPKPFD